MIKHFSWVVPALTVAALTTPALSQTKEVDQKYCNALVQTYHNTKSGGHAHSMQTFDTRGVEITTAIEQCRSGETAKAIPTLEKYLTEQKVALPARPKS